MRWIRISKYIKASEAKELTRKNINEGNTKEISDVFEIIKKGIENGEYSVDYYGSMRKNTQEHIESLGYRVQYKQCGMNEYCWRISW